ncbi:helix-turn-helix domain-containing protein [Streptomyces sp. NPDC059788]|uniref:helix-turn-helix domain-containing protein n=1 Tax=Streptomyces sp. NPDC059788 TaxID=3346948 RepID=UPI0036462FB9
MDTRGSTGPSEARDVTEFLAMLRELKERRNLTYRQLEQRAAERGEVLARSTLADVLSGRRLPRPEVLAVFVRACGEGDEQVAVWLDARENVAARGRTGPGSATEPPTVERPRRLPLPAGARRAPVLIAATVALALALAGTTVWLLTTGGSPGQSPAGASAAPSENGGQHARQAGRGNGAAGTKSGAAADVRSRKAAVPAGWIRIRPTAAPTLCVTDGLVQDKRYESLVAVQRPCGDVPPQRTELEPVGTDTYRIAWFHPDHGKGCLKALSGGAADGLLEPWEACARAGSFRVDPAPEAEPSGTSGKTAVGAVGRYVFRTDDGHCLGVRDSRTTAGAEVTLQRCTGGDGQAFLIDPAP